MIENSRVQQYQQDGVVCLRDVFDPKWIDMMHLGIERNITTPGPFFRDHTSEGSPGRYIFDFWNWRAIPEFRDVMFNSPLGELGGEILGCDRVTMLMDNWFLREAGSVDAAQQFSENVPFDCMGDDYHRMPDIGERDYDLVSWDLNRGDCLVFDFRTIHAGSSRSAPATARRMTFRLGGNDVRFEPRGEWTREISEHLVKQGQAPGQPLCNPLTPVIYER
jgi:hypothetical protein